MMRVTKAASQPRAVLFDAVGTLLYADPPVAEVYRRSGLRHGVDLSARQIGLRIAFAMTQHFAGRTESSEEIERVRWQTIVAEVFNDTPDRSDAIFADLWAHFASPEAWRTFDDVEACLAALAKNGYRVGIASNFDGRLKSVCDGHRVLRDVETFCSSDLGFAKPHVQFFRGIERRLDLPPTALALIGDDPVADHHGALDAGWQSYLLTRDDAGKSGPMQSLRQLPDLLARKPV